MLGINEMRRYLSTSGTKLTAAYLLVASHGGHWVQMRRLAPALEGLDQHYVSTNLVLADSVLPVEMQNIASLLYKRE